MLVSRIDGFGFHSLITDENIKHEIEFEKEHMMLKLSHKHIPNEYICDFYRQTLI